MYTSSNYLGGNRNKATMPRHPAKITQVIINLVLISVLVGVNPVSVKASTQAGILSELKSNDSQLFENNLSKNNTDEGNTWSPSSSGFYEPDLTDPDPAASFDGEDDRVTIPSVSEINSTGPYYAKTIELWFNTSRLTGQQVLYEQGGENQGLNIFLDGADLNVGAWTGGVGNWVSTAVGTGTTYHVTLVYSGTITVGGTGALTGYLNGASFGSTVTSFGSIVSHGGGIGIGGIYDNTRYPGGPRSPVANGDNFAGTIDEVVLYNQVLAPARILSHAQCGVNASCNYPVTAISDGPIAYWRLDEGSGSTAANLGTVGSLANGTYQNGVVQNQPGLILAIEPDTAVSINGVDGRVTIPINSQINSGGPYTAKTVELWFKAGSLTGRQMLYEQGGDLNGLNLFLDGSSIYVGAWATRASVTYSTWVTTTVALDTAYHVTLVYSGTVTGNTGILTGYLNGVSFKSVPTSFGNIPGAARGIGFGSVNDYTRYPDGTGQIANGNYFTGVLDEAAQYNQVLAPARILSHTLCGSTPGCIYPINVSIDSPIAFWRLNETGGTTAYNIGTIGKAVDGTYLNGVLLNQPGLTGNPICYTLTTAVNPGGSGTVDATPAANCSGGKYTAGTVVTLTAAPAIGYDFSYWSGGASGGTNPTTVTMSADKSVTANFIQGGYTLTITAVNGTVAKDPDKATYSNGEVVQLTATAAAGYGFSSWSGDLTGINNPENIIMNGNKAVTANFTLITHALTVTKAGTGSGTVTSVPSGIDCGATCSFSFIENTPVTLTASPSAGSTFTGWSGACTGTGTCDVTMDTAKSLTATFTQDIYTLTVVSAHGPVTKNPDQATYTYGQGVVLTMGSVEAGWTFTGWSGGGCGGTAPCTVTINGNTTVTANFVPEFTGTDPAASFDGEDDRVTIPSVSEINSTGPYYAKTIELWFNTSRLTGQQVLYEQGGENQGLNIFLDGANLNVGAWTGGVGNWVSTAVGTGTTYHVTLVYSGTITVGGTGALTGYLNGASFGSTVTSFGSIVSHGGGIGIGGIYDNTRYPGGPRSPVANGDNFAGTIDEVVLYNQVLAPARILSHAQCGVNASCNYPVTAISDGPIAYWRLDEGSGSTAANLGTVGSLANGTYQNGVVQNQPGLILAIEPDTAVSFNGADGRVTIPVNSQINSGGPYTAKTVELWFKAGSLTGRQMLYEQGGDLNGLNLFLDGSSIYVGAWATRASVTYSTWVTTTVALDTAYHVTLVYSGTVTGNTGILTGYLNGVSFKSVPTSFGNIPGAARGIGFGSVNDYTRYPDGTGQIANGNYFTGVLDEAAQYNQVLAPARILSHALCGSTPGCIYPINVSIDSPIAFWRLNETGGTTAYNIGTIGKAVDGTYLNGVLLNQPGLTGNPICYTLTTAVNPGGSGTVDATPAVNCSDGKYTAGTVVTLTGTPTAGWGSSSWSGDLISTTNPANITILGNKSVTANFSHNTYLLTVIRTGSGSGTVTSVPSGIDCGATCSASFNTSVILTAAASTGSTFTGWSGACMGTGTCTVPMTEATSVTATFTLNSYALTVTKPGTGSGTVTSVPSGIDCGATCTASYNYNTSVTLTAAASTGSTFTGWGGACTGTGTCTVTMDAAKSVTATFTLNSYALTVTKPGTGSGTVTSVPSGINCGATCTANFNYNTSVTLTAAAATGSTFTGWGGACTGTGACTVTMDAARSVTATFTVQCFTVNTSVSPAGSGSVNVSPASNCTGGKYTYGTVVTITAIESAGYTFDSWSGDLAGKANPKNLTVDADKSVTAHFTQNQYTLTAGNDGHGTVTLNPAGGTYASGTVVTLTPVPSAGYQFGSWSGANSGDIINTAGVYTIVMNGNKTVQANFTQITYTLTAGNDGHGTVTLNPAGGTYASGTVVTLTPVPSAGYQFGSWSGANSGDIINTAGVYTIVMNGNKTVQANFTQITYTLTAGNDGHGTVTLNCSRWDICFWHGGDADAGAQCGLPVRLLVRRRCRRYHQHRWCVHDRDEWEQDRPGELYANNVHADGRQRWTWHGDAESSRWDICFWYGGDADAGAQCGLPVRLLVRRQFWRHHQHRWCVHDRDEWEQDRPGELYANNVHADGWQRWTWHGDAEFSRWDICFWYGGDADAGAQCGLPVRLLVRRQFWRHHQHRWCIHDRDEWEQDRPGELYANRLHAGNHIRPWHGRQESFSAELPLR